MNLRYRISTILASSFLLVSGLFVAACGDDDLDNIQTSVNGVTLQSFGPCPLTRGSSMEVVGIGLGKVSKVLFPKGNQRLYDTKTYEEASFKMDEDGKLAVTVPDDVVPGKLRLVVGSDTIVSNGNLSFNEKVTLKEIALASSDMRAGDIITISGEYVWNIVSLTFADDVEVYAEDFLKNTRSELQVAVPAAAASGAVTYYDGNANEVQAMLIENLQIRQATVERLSNESPELGDEIIIYGKDLDLVGCAHFPFADSVKVEVNEAGTELKCVVPLKTIVGDINLAQYSGKKIPVSFAPLMIEVSEITPKEDLNAGDQVTIIGSRLDKVQYITLPGDIALAADEFSGSATQIIFTVPEGMGDGKVNVVQHENYSIETESIAMHHEGTEIPIWSGTFDGSGWAGFEVYKKSDYDWNTLTEGQQIIAYYKTTTPDLGWGCICFKTAADGWPALSLGQVDFSGSADEQKIVFIPTEGDIANLKSGNGLVLQGDGYILSKICITVAEQVIWRGTFNGSGWAGLEVYKESEYDWTTFTIDQKIVVTYASTTPDLSWGCINFKTAAAGWPMLSPGQLDFSGSAEDKIIEFIPTAEDVSMLNNGNGLVIQGDGYILKKISIK